MKIPIAIGILALLWVVPCQAGSPAKPDPRQRAYALIDEQQAEAALSTGDVVLLEDALAAAQAKLASLPPLDAKTPADGLEVHLAWQLFWYRLRALGNGDDTNLYARELAFLACFPEPERLATVRTSFRRLFQARELMAKHPQISRVAFAQHADFAQAIEAYAPRFALATDAVLAARRKPLVDTASVYASRWADAALQQAREDLHTGPAAVFAVIERHDLTRDRADLARARTVATRSQAVYWLNRVKVRLLVLQDAVNLLHTDPRVHQMVAWHEARGPLYRDPRNGGLVEEIELYATVAPALAHLHDGQLLEIRNLGEQIAAVERRIRKLPPDDPPAGAAAELFVLDHPGGFLR